MPEGKTEDRRKFGKRTGAYRFQKLPAVDPNDLVKGQVITDVRESEDVIEAVKDRLKLWPTGGEIIALLVMMQCEQINKSWRKTVENVKAEPSAVVEEVVVEDLKKSPVGKRKEEEKRT